MKVRGHFHVQFVTKLSNEGVTWNITSTQFMRKRNLIDINAQFVIFKHPQIKSCKSIFIKFIRQIFTVEIDTLENCILSSICILNQRYMSRFFGCMYFTFKSLVNKLTISFIRTSNVLCFDLFKVYRVFWAWILLSPG